VGCVYRRYQRLWIKFQDAKGKWIYRSTDYRPGQEAQARKLLRRVEEKIAQGGTPDNGPLTVAKYASKWIREYKEMGIAEWENHEARLRLHVLPVIGELPIDDVRPRHIAELFKNLRRKGRHAPKTIHNIYSAVQGLFREAEVEGLVDRSPCVLTAHHLGPLEDKNSGWRNTAVFNREELETLAFDQRIPEDRRVLYALEGIGALRHGEAAGLRWQHYDPYLDVLTPNVLPETGPENRQGTA
jgi:integrase